MELDLKLYFDQRLKELNFKSTIRGDRKDEPAQFYFLERAREYISSRVSRMSPSFSYHIAAEPYKKGRRNASGISVFRDWESKRLGKFERNIFANILVKEGFGKIEIETSAHTMPSLREDYYKFLTRLIDFHEKCYGVNIDLSRKFLEQEARTGYEFDSHITKVENIRKKLHEGARNEILLGEHLTSKKFYSIIGINPENI